jgi:hypothetical protein
MSAKDICERGMMDLVDGTLLSSSEKPLFCRLSDPPPLTAIQFLEAYFSSSSGVRKSRND